MKTSRLALVGIALMTGLGSASAGPVLWDLGVGGNGHYYDIINTPNLTWDQANAAANALTFNGLRGHLVTITSADEQAFLAANITLPASKLVWLGGYQDTSAPDYSEPGGGWRWVTGEAFSYTNWNQDSNPNNNEPNNNGGSENYLQTYNITPWKWNDVADSPPAGFKPAAFVVEYEATVAPAPPGLVLAGVGLATLGAWRWGRSRPAPAGGIAA